MPQIGKLRPSRVESVTPILMRALDDEAATVRMGAAVALVSLGVQSLEGDANEKFEAAKKLYATRAATSPDHAPTQLALGKFYVLSHDLAGAAAAFAASLKLDPDQKDAVYFRAIVRLGEGKTEEARRLLGEVDETSEYRQSAQALLATLPKR
jgi:tetratricopeptide (TPR) repeat protein